jgi:hypothetical protein
MKTIEQHFADWESGTFGYGYGSGEGPVFQALKQFLALCCEGRLAHAYDHDALSAALTPAVAWLLINALCRADILEYGTSSRYGWLTPQGEALKAFVCGRTVEQLEIAAQDDEMVCYRDHCNCDDGDCRPLNPFWPKRNT